MKFKNTIILTVLTAFSLTVQAQKPLEITQAKPDGKMPLVFKKGIAAVDALKVSYTQADQSVLTIELKQPVMVSVADQPQKWGHYQFPNLYTTPKGDIQVRWNLNNDNIEAYGQNNFGSAVSKDKGKTWSKTDSAVFTGEIILKNGDRLEVYTPKPIKVEDLKMPKAIGEGLENYRKSNFNYYRLHDLPESRQGVYLKRLKKGEGIYQIEHAKLTDHDAARYSLAGLVPIVWWGDMHTAKDGSLVIGIYPGVLISKDGIRDPKSGVFFYRSTDNGQSWNVLGRIPFSEDLIGDALGSKRMGFTEPAFEILADGTYLCVMRTTDGAGNGPMYGSYSKDEGKTWTKPVAIVGGGVLPRLLKLDNGVTVMSSGRPGVQLRFSTDPNGLKWTDAFEMLPFTADFNEAQPVKINTSCGYTGLLPMGKDKFLIVYSDFMVKNENNENRKAIKVREVVVKKKF
jgi:hypothetical protein